jgi:preprotein translocase subunit Sec61beta
MSGWLRYFTLNAQARTGFSPQVAVWAAIAVVAAVVAAVFLLVAAFIWLAQRYDSLTAGLVLGGVFIVVALTAFLACLITRRRNVTRARLELAARDSAGSGFLDPKLLGVGLQIAQAIGWRRIIALGAVGVLAAALAKEWRGGDDGGAADDAAPPAG